MAMNRINYSNDVNCIWSIGCRCTICTDNILPLSHQCRYMYTTTLQYAHMLAVITLSRYELSVYSMWS